MDPYETWIMESMSGGKTQTFEAYSTDQTFKVSKCYPTDWNGLAMYTAGEAVLDQ